MSDVSVLSGPTGGDPTTQSAEMNAQYNQGNTTWVLVSAVLVWIMIPGVGFLYSGLARRHSSTALLWQSFIAAGVITFQWFFWGYSLAFSHTAGVFIGDLANFGSHNVLAAPSVGSALVPDILFYIFQLMFAAVTAMLMLGGAMERGRLMPGAIFIFIWSTIVYDPIACWTWNPSGWLFKLGGLDFAGGGPVHMTSGAGAIAYALVLGKRRQPGHATGKMMPRHKPSNVFFVVLGTIFLWFGWFGFNGGSALNGSLRAVYACVVTNLAAASGAITYSLLDYRHGKKWSMLGACTGAIAGLVGITPGSGYTPIYFAVPTGVITAIVCNFAMDIKDILRIDDGLDVFALHGVGGFVGSICTGLFAADYIAALDGTVIKGGWICGHWKQLGYQLAGSCAILSYAFTVSYILLYGINKIPGLHLRISDEHEENGLDNLEIGEILLEYGIQNIFDKGVEKIQEEEKRKGVIEGIEVNTQDGSSDGEKGKQS